MPNNRRGLGYIGSSGSVLVQRPTIDAEMDWEFPSIGNTVETYGTSYGITGTVANGNYPVFGIYLPVHQTSQIVRVFLATGSGSATVTITDSGANIAGLTGLTATTTPTFASITPYALSDGHYVGLTVSNSNATNLSVTLFRQDSVLAGTGLDTPWSIDHDAAGHSLLNANSISVMTIQNLLHIGAGGNAPTSANLNANVALVSFGGAAFDLYGQVVMTTSGGGVIAANTPLFDIVLNVPFTFTTCTPNIAAFDINAATVNGWFASQSGTPSSSFTVFNSFAIPAPSQSYTITYINLGN